MRAIQEEDVTSVISAWLRRISQEAAPPDEIVAFNIGIFESPTGFTVYLAGSAEFDADDDDWACTEDYSPLERYLELPSEFVRGKDWQSIEADLIDIFGQILASETETIFSKVEFVTVGFDDGSLGRIK